MWSRGPAFTCRVAVPLAPPVVPVTVWAPATEAVQLFAVQEPLGAMENAVDGVRSPSELLYWSRPCAVYAWEPPAVIVAEAGESARWSSGPGFTASDPVLVLPE